MKEIQMKNKMYSLWLYYFLMIITETPYIYINKEDQCEPIESYVAVPVFLSTPQIHFP